MLDKIKEIVNPKTDNDFSKQIALSTLENLEAYMIDANIDDKILTLIYILDNFQNSNLVSLLRNYRNLFELIAQINKNYIDKSDLSVDRLYNLIINEV